MDKYEYGQGREESCDNRGVLTNQTYSNRVVRSEFDRKWDSRIQGSYVVYTATENNAQVMVLIEGDVTLLITFNYGGQVWVGGGGTSHYSKPHWVKRLYS